MIVEYIHVLLILLFCHYLADFTHLSTPWMLKAKSIGDPLLPIFVHSLVHGVLFYVALSFMAGSNAAFLGFVSQITTHFLIDYFKGRLSYYFPNTIGNPAHNFHWLIFGLDQMLHIYVIILLAYFVI